MDFEAYNKLQMLRNPDNNYGMYVIPKADAVFLHYYKMKLEDEFPAPSKKAIKTLIVDGRKTILGRKEKHIFVEGYVGKKDFFAYDILFSKTDDVDDAKYFPGVNRSLSRAILNGKGFRLLPYQLAGRVDSPDNKSKHNKAMYKCLLENAKHFKIPVQSVQIIHQVTREVVYEKLMEK